jgi:tetratricopeptide (TPR) repeat protein
VAAGDDDRRGVRLWELATGASLEVVPDAASARVAFSPDDQWLVVGTTDGYDVHRTGTWEQVAHLPRRVHSSPSPAAFSPDGALLAAQTSAGVVTLFETATWRPLVRLESTYLEETEAVGFTPDGGRLLVFSQAGSAVRCWDLRFLRDRLRGMRLDWDPPGRAPAEAPPAEVRVEFDAGAAEPARWLRSGQEHAAARRFDQAAADFTQALDLNPALKEARTGRGIVYACARVWHFAADDLPPPTGRAVVSDVGAQAAALQLLARDGTGYALTRARVATEVGTGRPSELMLYDASRVCTLTAEAEDAARVLGWAEQALKGDRSPWRLHVSARAQYRAGQFEAAVDRAEESLTFGRRWPGQPLNWLVLALANHHLGRGAAAQEWLATATTWQNSLSKEVGRIRCPAGLHLTDWLEFNVLLAEAELVIPRPGPKK